MTRENSRILFVTHNCYLDDSNGAAVASRSMLESLARAGFEAEVLSGITLELGEEVDIDSWLAARYPTSTSAGSSEWTADARGTRVDLPPFIHLTAGNIPVTLHRGPTCRPHPPDGPESHEFLRLLDLIADRFHPRVVVNYGGDDLANRVRREARDRGAAVVFPLHNFAYDDATTFATTDAVLVPSTFAAGHYFSTLGLRCEHLPNIIDVARIRVAKHRPTYVTFVNPSYEKGVFPFARIADELGRRRPDIPFLVVEGRGVERTLADCGLDLRAHGNVSLMGHTPDPRHFWSVTRIALMPSLWWENQPLVAIEAMRNGIPVVGSDRGGIPEVLGSSGIVLPLPARLSPATRFLPTAEEIGPWVEAIVSLWDSPDLYAEQSERALIEARRWDPEVVEPLYERFFRSLMSGDTTRKIGI